MRDGVAMNNEYLLKCVWQSIDETLSEEIVRFWLDNNALPSKDVALQRVNQVAFIARARSGELIAINTAYLKRNEKIGEYFYYIRAFVTEHARRSQVAAEMLRRLQYQFEGLYEDGMLTPAIGLCMEVENPAIKQSRNEAIWPTTKFIYVGKTPEGNHVRVYYFKSAKIS
tara:strand:+ start:142 stop:651 length:510 start_codon:yes stop_codon:yes gene_type:complete